MILKCDRIHSERNYGYLINTIETNGEEMSSKVFNKKLRIVQERTEHIHNIVDEEQIETSSSETFKAVVWHKTLNQGIILKR